MSGSEPICSPVEQTETNPVRDLNDKLRTTFEGGRVMVTHGVQALGSAAVAVILQAVARFDDFTPDNDPHCEHDFGAFEYGSETVFWKFDYYDSSLEFGSPNPADPAVTTRVLTILLASEY